MQKYENLKDSKRLGGSRRKSKNSQYNDKNKVIYKTLHRSSKTISTNILEGELRRVWRYQKVN